MNYDQLMTSKDLAVAVGCDLKRVRFILSSRRQTIPRFGTIGQTAVYGPDTVPILQREIDGQRTHTAHRT